MWWIDIKGLIVSKGEDVYSKFLNIFENIKELEQDYNWLISNIECYPENLEYRKIFDKNYLWISGKELYKILKEEDFQWIWGVLSGFKKDIELKEVLQQELPYANGYNGFWNNPITIQHKLADIEIVAWDGLCSLFISKNENIIKYISKIYLSAKDLEEYNLF